MFQRFVIRLNNFIVSLLPLRAPANRILLLLPHCLQKPECKQDVTEGILNCRQCGGCSLAEIVDFHRVNGLQVAVVRGGRQAVNVLRESSARLVVAVACEKELYSGILATLFSKAVFAIENTQPHGPCRHTSVEIEKIKEVLQKVVATG